MIAKFFSKSTPLHFIIVAFLLFLGFIWAQFTYNQEPVGALIIAKQMLVYGICFFSLFVFDFLTSKNSLTKKNNYKILFYGLFMLMLPETFLNTHLIVANLFVLFAVRRLVSLRSKKQLKKKILDATFWICLATLFYFWSFLFFSLIFVALFLYKISDTRNWIIPILGVIMVALIGTSLLMLSETDLTNYFSNFYSGISFDFSNLNSKSIIIATTVIFTYFLWSLFYYLKNIKTKSKKYRSSYLIILMMAILAITIVMIAPNKNGSEFIFLIAPLSIIVTNYIEIIQEKWFKESLIWLLIIAVGTTLVL